MMTYSDIIPNSAKPMKKSKSKGFLSKRNDSAAVSSITSASGDWLSLSKNALTSSESKAKFDDENGDNENETVDTATERLQQVCEN
jgi:hypothetical protein